MIHHQHMRLSGCVRGSSRAVGMRSRGEFYAFVVRARARAGYLHLLTCWGSRHAGFEGGVGVGVAAVWGGGSGGRGRVWWVRGFAKVGVGGCSSVGA